MVANDFWPFTFDATWALIRGLIVQFLELCVKVDVIHPAGRVPDARHQKELKKSKGAFSCRQIERRPLPPRIYCGPPNPHGEGNQRWTRGRTCCGWERNPLSARR